MLWKVPITVATKGNPLAASLMLSEQSTTVTLEGVAEGDWVLVSETTLCSSSHSGAFDINFVCVVECSVLEYSNALCV